MNIGEEQEVKEVQPLWLPEPIREPQGPERIPAKVPDKEPVHAEP